MKLPQTFVAERKIINVIIETLKGSGNKCAPVPEAQYFKLGNILPNGLIFPLHFGFIPGTKGDDGDPQDVMVLMDKPTYPGNLIECKVFGLIEAEQTEKDGKSMRNDRLLPLSIASLRYGEYKTIKVPDKYLLKAITIFWVTYNKMSKKKFKARDTNGAHTAISLVKKHINEGIIV